MQTDLRLLLLIVGLVYAVYTLFNIFSGRQRKKQVKGREKFDQTVMEGHRVPEKSSTHPKKIKAVDENDPLLTDSVIVRAPAKEAIHYKSAVQETVIQETLTQEMPEQPAESHLVSERKKRLEAPTHRDIISFSIIAKQANGFSGRLLLSTLRANHFHFDNKIFHSHRNNNLSEPVECSIACLVEPGIFDWQQITSRTYPGLVIWMKLTGTEQDILQFEKLLTTAKQIAASLNATLCDDARHPLSVQSIALYRARLKENLNPSFSLKDEFV